jgi:hypothetical protein
MNNDDGGSVRNGVDWPVGCIGKRQKQKRKKKKKPGRERPTLRSAAGALRPVRSSLDKLGSGRQRWVCSAAVAMAGVGIPQVRSSRLCKPCPSRRRQRVGSFSLPGEAGPRCVHVRYLGYNVVLVCYWLALCFLFGGQ